MHDYFAAAAGLQAGTLHASNVISPGDPLAAQLFPLTSQPSQALLGALFESMVAQSTGSDEMKRLDKALDLWTTLTALFDQLKVARAALEAGVVDASDPDKAIPAIAAAANARDTILPKIQDWTKQATDFIQNPDLLDYLPKSGQASDSNPKTWHWPELVMARRTGALRAGLLKSSAGTAGMAMALGAVSGYATQLTVASWRNAVVGGPPRNHPLRSRLVARTAGAWLRAHTPALTPSLSSLLVLLETGVGPSLPAGLANQLETAMKDAYGAFLPTKAPLDFEKAYRSMLRHLSILDQLRFWRDVPAGQPAVPVIPRPSLLPVMLLVQAAAIAGGPAPGGGATGQGSAIKIQAGHGLGGGQGGTNVKAKAYTGKSGAEWWKIALAVLVTILLTAAGIVGGLLLGGVGAGILGPVGLGLGAAFGEAIGAWENNSHDTLAHAQQALGTPDAAAICKALFDLDITLYSVASQFMTMLKGAGLAYPEALDLGTPPFNELLTIQSLDIHRAMPTQESFTAYPTSPLELATALPTTPSLPYGPGALPNSAITWSEAATRAHIEAASLALALWRSCFFGEKVLAQENHNLDADRGFAMLCWSGLTKSQPISIQLLPYQAV